MKLLATVALATPPAALTMSLESTDHGVCSFLPRHDDPITSQSKRGQRKSPYGELENLFAPAKPHAALTLHGLSHFLDA